MKAKNQDKPSIIIRKEEIVEGGHHGGAWKVAYADFVTAMMAFFLLMWLLNATTQEQRRGLADYFSPSNQLSKVTSGFGAPFGGRTPHADGPLASDQSPIQIGKNQPHPVVDADDEEADTPAEGAPPKVVGEAPRPMAREGGTAPAQDLAKVPDQEIQKEAERREKQEFERASQQIQEAVRSDPALADLAKQLAIDITPEGLRIQLLDADRTPMFNTGSAALNDRARALLAKIAPILIKMPEPLAIAGHTDAAQYRGGDRSNWDLSADRANATRRLLVDAGLPEARLRTVTGHADRDPLITADPMAAANRRVAIVMLRSAPAR